MAVVGIAQLAWIQLVRNLPLTSPRLRPINTQQQNQRKASGPVWNRDRSWIPAEENNLTKQKKRKEKHTISDKIFHKQEKRLAIKTKRTLNEHTLSQMGTFIASLANDSSPGRHLCVFSGTDGWCCCCQHHYCLLPATRYSLFSQEGSACLSWPSVPSLTLMFIDWLPSRISRSGLP